MDVEAHQRAAGSLIHLDMFHVQRMHGELVAVALALWRRRAAVAGRAEVGAGLQCAGGQRGLPEPAPCGSSRTSAGMLATIQCHQPEPVGASGS